MKKMIVIFLLVPFISFSQDSLLTYQRVLQVDSLSKDQIFDKALIWCSKTFNNSKYAIDVQERAGGIIAGKAYYLSPYMVPNKKDSVEALKKNWLAFHEYYFDWVIEIKDNKLRFSLKDIEVTKYEGDKVNVTTSQYSPFPVSFQSKEKTNLYWMLSKKYFVVNMDNLMASLDHELNEKKSDW